MKLKESTAVVSRGFLARPFDKIPREESSRGEDSFLPDFNDILKKNQFFEGSNL